MPRTRAVILSQHLSVLLFILAVLKELAETLASDERLTDIWPLERQTTSMLKGIATKYASLRLSRPEAAECVLASFLAILTLF